MQNLVLSRKLDGKYSTSPRGEATWGWKPYMESWDNSAPDGITKNTKCRCCTSNVGSAGTLRLSNPRKKNNLSERSPECNEPDTPAVRLPGTTIQPVGL